MALWLDFETRSECDLKAAGVYNYARHGTTRVPNPNPHAVCGTA